MATKSIFLLSFAFVSQVFSFQAFALPVLRIVTCTQDLAALAEKVSAGRNEIISLGKGLQDPHQIEAKPSFLVTLRAADLVVSQGLELESAWINPLIEGSRNPKIARASKGYFELGPLLDPLEIPEGPLSRSEGDIHAHGNPHYQLDPIRMGTAAILLAEKLADLDPLGKQVYVQNAKSYQALLKNKSQEWKQRLEKAGVKEVVTYHKTFAYFLDRYGIKNKMFIEPKPGIPPSTKHLQTLIAQMKHEKVKLVLIENYFSDESIKKIKSEYPETQGFLVPVSVGGSSNIGSTEELIENLVKIIEHSIL